MMTMLWNINHDSNTSSSTTASAHNSDYSRRLRILTHYNAINLRVCSCWAHIHIRIIPDMSLRLYIHSRHRQPLQRMCFNWAQIGNSNTNASIHAMTTTTSINLLHTQQAIDQISLLMMTKKNSQSIHEKKLKNSKTNDCLQYLGFARGHPPYY